MKIGILTFHCAHNYGAVLQCYALQQYLINCNHEVYIIDYKQKYLIGAYKPLKLVYWFSRTIKKTIRKWLTEPFKIRDRFFFYKMFNSFIKNYLNLYPCSIHDKFEEFDYIICGSDQIWNPKLLGGKTDPMYLGGNATCRIISYAASLGLSSLSNDEMSFLEKKLSHFYAIGVREKSLCDLLQPLVSIPIHVNIDPTLLLQAKDYEPIIASPSFNKPYLLIYQVDICNEVYIIARKIAKQLNLEIIEIDRNLVKRQNAVVRVTPSVESFLGYIKNAQCVITTSFHGTAFSLIFNRPFYVLKQQNDRDLRVSSLLSFLELNDRFIDQQSLNDISFKPIEYEAINTKIAQLSLNSKIYLKETLK